MKGMWVLWCLGLLSILFFPQAMADEGEGTDETSEEDAERIEAVSKIRPDNFFQSVVEGGPGASHIYDGERVLVGTPYKITTLWHNYGNYTVHDVKLNIYEDGSLIGHTLLDSYANGLNWYAEPYEFWIPIEAGEYTLRIELDLYPKSNVTLTFEAVEHRADLTVREDPDREVEGQGSEGGENDIWKGDYLHILLILGIVVAMGVVASLILAIRNLRKGH